jgi:predicted secreted protein
MMQRYSDSGISAPPEVWKGTQHVSCVRRDKDGLQGALTELQEQGAIVTEMHFDLVPETWAKTRKELVSEAISALRARALQIAEAMGMQVDRYLNIQVNEENDQRQIQLRQIRFQENGGPLALPSGDIEVSVAATISVRLAPKSIP